MTRLAPVEPTTDDTHVMTLFQELRDEAGGIRAAQTLMPDVRNMMKDVVSPFTANILADDFTRDFLLPRIPAYDGKADPFCHIQQY